MKHVGGATVYNGECVETMTTLARAGVQVDSIVTDPPYHLTSGGKGGFMGKEWDGGNVAFRAETWRGAERCNGDYIQKIMQNFKWSGWNSKEVIEYL